MASSRGILSRVSTNSVSGELGLRCISSSVCSRSVYFSGARFRPSIFQARSLRPAWDKREFREFKEINETEEQLADRERGNQLRRLRRCSTQRGTKELDLIFGTYFLKYGEEIVGEEKRKSDFESLLEMETPEMFNLLVGEGTSDLEIQNEEFRRMREFIKSSEFSQVLSQSSNLL